MTQQISFAALCEQTLSLMKQIGDVDSFETREDRVYVEEVDPNIDVDGLSEKLAALGWRKTVSAVNLHEWDHKVTAAWVAIGDCVNPRRFHEDDMMLGLIFWYDRRMRRNSN